MIRVYLQDEPINFEKDVREPGKDFLQSNPQPRSWKNRDYWTKVLPELYRLHGGICSYCAEWIPETVGNPTIDHFIPKSIRPEYAYEWGNFRLASLRYNRHKGNHQDVLDPLTVENGWFWIHFPSIQLKPSSNLNDIQKQQVWSTITRLRLNDRISVKSRKRWVVDFCEGDISFNFLKRNAPLIAQELERQDIVDKITVIMKIKPKKIRK